MSPTDRSMSGIKGKRVPGRPGRFDPSEPLHMTTRRAAKGGPGNGSPSLNGSVADDESRRGSFDDTRPFTSHSNASQISARSGRLSDASLPSNNNNTPDTATNGVHDMDDDKLDDSVFQTLPPLEQSQSPSRKRKRSTSYDKEATSEQLANSATATSEHQDVPMNDAPTQVDNGATAELIQPHEMSDRALPPSQESSRFGEGASNTNDLLMAPSMDATPAISGEVSPATTDSISQENMTSAKQLGAALEIARAEQEDQEIEDAGDAADDMEDGEEVDEQARDDDDDTRPRRGRFGGRRRAKHAIPRIEAMMQRQSELKSLYRSMARAQKAVLAAIAQRTIDNLEADPELHKQSAEHTVIMAGLDNALARRKAQIQAQSDLTKQQLKSTYDAQRTARKMTAKNMMNDEKEKSYDALEYEVLRISRAALRHGQDVDTDDEDDVVPRPKGMNYRYKKTGTLDPAYDSRSGRNIDIKDGMDRLESRIKMRQMLDALEEDDRPEEDENFAIGRDSLRTMSLEQRYGKLNTRILADASVEVERLDKLERAAKIIPNSEAVGLQILSEQASQLSNTRSTPTPGYSSKGSHSFVGQTPPHRHLQTDGEQGKIPLEMSPRTSKAMNERFATPHQQPATPHHREPASIRSSFPGPADSQLQSPPSRGSRSDVYSLLSGKQPGARPKSQSGPIGSQLREPQAQLSASPFAPGSMLDAKWHERSDSQQWRPQPSEQRSVFETRPSVHDDRSRFGFMAHDGRPRYGSQDERGDQGLTRNEFTPQYYPSQQPPRFQRDQSSQQGTNDANGERPRSPQGGARRATMDMSRSPRSRNSATFSVHDIRRDTDSQSKYRVMKPNKEQRNGRSRRQHSFSKDHKIERPLSKPGPASALPTSAMSPTFPPSATHRPGPPPSWQSSPPLQSPLGPPPPSVWGGQGSFNSRPPPPFPGKPKEPSQGFQPQPPASIWNQPSPSPLYAVPQHQYPPHPSEQYNRYEQNQQAGFPPHPSSAHPPNSAPGPYGPQYGGPPLAPAAPNQTGFHPHGFRPPQPMPAFAQQAQQQQQQGGPAGHRRRAQSDGFSKFQAFDPHSGSSRR